MSESRDNESVFMDSLMDCIHEPGDPIDNPEAIYCQMCRGFVNPASSIQYDNQVLPFLVACDCASGSEGNVHYHLCVNKIQQHLNRKKE